MNDDISRQAAIVAVNKYFSRIGKLKRHGLKNTEKAINMGLIYAIGTLPSADVRENVKGSLIEPYLEEYYGEWYYCSVCGSSMQGGNFCSYCGAKMQLSNEDATFK